MSFFSKWQEPFDYSSISLSLVTFPQAFHYKSPCKAGRYLIFSFNIVARDNRCQKCIILGRLPIFLRLPIEALSIWALLLACACAGYHYYFVTFLSFPPHSTTVFQSGEDWHRMRTQTWTRIKSFLILLWQLRLLFIVHPLFLWVHEYYRWCLCNAWRTSHESSGIFP